MHHSLWGDLQPRTQAMLLCISAFPAQSSPIRGLFIQTFPKYFCQDHFIRGEREPWRYSLYSESVLSTPSPPLSSQAHKMAGTFCLRFLGQWGDITSLLIHLIHVISWGKMEQEGAITSSCLYHCSKWLRPCLFLLFWFVLLISYFNTCHLNSLHSAQHLTRMRSWRTCWLLK